MPSGTDYTYSHAVKVFNIKSHSGEQRRPSQFKRRSDRGVAEFLDRRPTG